MSSHKKPIHTKNTTQAIAAGLPAAKEAAENLQTFQHQLGELRATPANNAPSQPTARAAAVARALSAAREDHPDDPSAALWQLRHDPFGLSVWSYKLVEGPGTAETLIQRDGTTVCGELTDWPDAGGWLVLDWPGDDAARQFADALGLEVTPDDNQDGRVWCALAGEQKGHAAAHKVADARPDAPTPRRPPEHRRRAKQKGTTPC